MRGQLGFFDVDERLEELSAKGDALERLGAIVNFEVFRADLSRAVPRSDGATGGRLSTSCSCALRGPSGQGARPPGQPRAVGRAH